MSDLAVVAFLALRNAFFDEAGKPREFDLRDKQNTMDDPLDVLVWETLRDASAEDVNGFVAQPGRDMRMPLLSISMQREWCSGFLVAKSD